MWELLLSFHRVGPEDAAPVVRLGHKHFYQMICLTTPHLVILKRLCLADYMYGPPYPDVGGGGPGVCGYVHVEYRWPRRPEQHWLLLELQL